jgi:hypothetical protein
VSQSCGPGAAGVRQDWKPFPSGIFIASLTQMRVALEARPRAMARDSCDLWDISADFEQPRNTIVTKVMEVQVTDVEELTRAREIRSDGVPYGQ